MKTKSRKVRLREVCDRITVGYVGPMKDEYVPEGISFLRSQNIQPFRLSLADIKFVSPEFHAKLRKSELKPGDVAIVRTGYPGTACVIPKSLPVSNCSDLVIITPNDKELDSGYLAAVFNSSWGMATVGGNLVGVAQQHFNVGAAKEMEINLPSLPTQRKIAGILSAYDDLIENNLRRIKILEQMAQSLYREWFVHFRFPGHESAKFADSELGRIPMGWEGVPLSKIINVTHGHAFKGDDFSVEPTTKVLTTPGNFRVGGGLKYDKLKYYSEEAPIKSGYVFKPMDLMLTMTDLSKAGDTLGYPAFIPNLKGLTFLHNQRIGRVIPVGDSFPKHFLHCLFCDDRYRHHIAGGATGLAVKHTSPSRILSFQAALPKTNQLIDQFDRKAEPIFRRVNLLIEAVENLRRTRDLLLPKLLAGDFH